MYSLKRLKELRNEHNYIILRYLDLKHGRIKQAIYKESKLNKSSVDTTLVSLYERGQIDMIETRKQNGALAGILYITTESGKQWLKKMKLKYR